MAEIIGTQDFWDKGQDITEDSMLKEVLHYCGDRNRNKDVISDQQRGPRDCVEIKQNNLDALNKRI